MLRFAQLTLLLCLLGGCTLIRIESADAVRVKLAAGVVRVESPQGSTDIVSYRVRGFGLVPSRNGITLGWASEDGVLANDLSDCRIIVFELPKDAKGADSWKELMAKRTDICVLGETTHDKPAE